MPPLPGEDRLVTVFADCHYYFGQPTVRPSVHRFDKGSYFYIYYNATRNSSRIEVANNPGTADQDAFNGYIDTCRITNSERFPTRLTIEVDGGTPQSPSSPKSSRDPQEWHLATGDPRDSSRTKYRLHTIDVYLWAQDDARLVLECFKKLLPAKQLNVPEYEHDQGFHEPETAMGQTPANQMSPVVQNLENMAVHDPVYNGQQKGANAVSPTSSFASHNIPPPPPVGGPARQPLHSPSPAISDLSSQPGRQSSIRSNKQQPADFAPMAYNPAAPAAPEPIAHREKTPPPEDHAGGTGLNQATRHDQMYVPGPPPQGSSQAGYQIGHGAPVTFGGGYASPPPQQPGLATSSSSHQQQLYAHTTSPPPPPSMTGYSSPPPPSGYSYGGQPDQRSSTGSAAPSFGPNPTGTLHQDSRGSAVSTAPSFGPGAPSTLSSQQSHPHNHSTAAEHYVPQSAHDPIPTPGTQFYSSLQPPNRPLSHVQPQYADYLAAGSTPIQNTSAGNLPPGGYSQYNYGQGAQQQQQQHHHHQQNNDNPYAIHQQVYRPTEAEAGSHHRKQSRTNTADGRHRKESTTDRVENRAKGLFKRVEKYF
ncbi:hypothetical protein LTR05_000434 [Lithohypha guttulata]|uniref:Uncharacterized protein n=1 Tax=Lithohypha guttulata TaxID=1690604 RepID=A0AAN7T595_9EURO|nr:hypothetical protein LTR05_000434 [Lithohypha guttulata]